MVSRLGDNGSVGSCTSNDVLIGERPFIIRDCVSEVVLVCNQVPLLVNLFYLNPNFEVLLCFFDSFLPYYALFSKAYSAFEV